MSDLGEFTYCCGCGAEFERDGRLAFGYDLAEANFDEDGVDHYSYENSLLPGFICDDCAAEVVMFLKMRLANREGRTIFVNGDAINAINLLTQDNKNNAD